MHTVSLVSVVPTAIDRTRKHTLFVDDRRTRRARNIYHFVRYADILCRSPGVFPEIRRKLAAVLVHWDPSDTSAFAMLSPWKNVFDPRSMEALLDKCIAPKLAAGLRASLVINPSNQVCVGARKHPGGCCILLLRRRLEHYVLELSVC